MAVTTTSIFYFVRDKVLTFLVKVSNTLKEVPNKVEEIKKDLERIEMYINVADRMAISKQDNNNNKDRDEIKTKVRKLTEAIFRIEDVIEEYNMIFEIKQQQQQQPGDPGCAEALPTDILADLIRSMLIRLRIAYEIQDIKSSVGKINGNSEGSSSSPTGSKEVTGHDLREAARYIKESEVVGFEDPKRKLEGWLLDEHEKRTVIIAVVGMGGQGKTTLAKTVYEKVNSKFDCYAWITVSESQTICRDPVEGLLRDMLKKFWEGKMEPPNKDISTMDRRKLIDEVRNYLQWKRYVVLLDDVLKEDLWSQIQLALFDNNMSSRVLITTRSMGVAQICQDSSIVQIHKLNPLSAEKSWELFSKKAFLNDLPSGVCPEGFEDISKKIVEKCEGLPLAILAVGGLLAYKARNLDEWEKLDKTLISELQKRPKSTGIRHILGPSYDDLPYCLQQCFLHFGIYPRGYELESATLIRKWIAEGFVKYQNNQTFEEVAEQYLEELINRSLVQVSSFNFDGKSIRCRVHDLLREIIVEKSKDLSFCHFVSQDDETNFSGMIRRLIIAIDSNNAVVPTHRSHIRSMYIFRGVELPEDFVRKILTIYKLLRVLDFEHAPLNYVPECLGTFFHLRYLSFRKTGIESLPKSIGNLHSLETLDLRQTSVCQMPKEINKLIKLRHLLVNHTVWFYDKGIQVTKEDIGRFKSLQTLRQVDTEYGGEELIRELEKLRQLRSLGLINVLQEHGRALCSLIVNMQKLQKLYVDAKFFDEIVDLHYVSSPPELLKKIRIRGKLQRLPKWIPNLKNLVSLSLIASNLTSDPLMSLQYSPNLLFLSLDSAYEGESLDFQDGKFRKLKKLTIRHLYNLNSINIGVGALHSLKVFVLDYIPELFMVPSGIMQLGKLEVFHIICMSDEFREAIAAHDWIHDHVRQVNIADSFRRNYWDRKPHYL